MAASWPRPLTALAAVTLAFAPPAQAEPIRSGFDLIALPQADDISGPATNLGFEVNFLGQTFSSLYVNSNGNLTFGAPLSAFSPVPLNQLGAMVVAPFFADVDTSIAGQVTYGVGNVDGRSAFGATWSGVPYHGTDPKGVNDFQAVLIDRADTGVGNFDLEFNYGEIAWETGDFSGGVGGVGGSSARVGYSGATPESSFEVVGSGTPGALLDSGSQALSSGLSASESAGRYSFSSRGGAFTVQSEAPPKAPPVPAESPLEVPELPTALPPEVPALPVELPPEVLPVPAPEPAPIIEEVPPSETVEEPPVVTPVEVMPLPDEVFPTAGPTPSLPAEESPPLAPIGVPEPATVLLATLGAGLVGLRRLRKLI